jgi:mannose-1-phosphate guanylyltransferase/mannose-6-phosphate isomerase
LAENTGVASKNIGRRFIVAKVKIDAYPVLLAGGSGTRLWPVSRELFPKQLVNFIGDESLIQTTVKRLLPLFDASKIRVVCGKNHSHDVIRDMDALAISVQGIAIDEPCGRNTAPAILLAVLEILKENRDALVFIFPADHLIGDVSLFHQSVQSAYSLALDGYIVTFGITPGYPEVGYGYIEASEIQRGAGFAIKRFVEKPDLKTAQKYLEAGCFYWNSGMFAFKASVVLDEFQKYKPQMVEQLKAMVTGKIPLNEDNYSRLESTSIDYAVMENTDKGVVLPVDFGWNDIGSWKSLYDFIPKDENGNVILSGDVILQNTKNCFVMGHKRLIALNNLEEVVIVVTPDAVFVSDMENSRDVKNIVATLKENGRREYRVHTTENKSWGYLKRLKDSDGSQINELVVFKNAEIPEMILEEQSKQLLVVEGEAKMIVDDQTCTLEESQALHIPAGSFHRVGNPGDKDLRLIEVIKGQ